MNDITIYITSWRRYNEGKEGTLIELDGIKDYDDILKELKSKGFDPSGYDEELTIHDYVDGALTYVLYNRFGESFNEDVIEAINELIDLKDYEIELLNAYDEIHGIGNNDIDYILQNNYIYEDIEDYLNEIHEIPEHLQPYIDYDAMIRYDSIYQLKDNNYLVSNN